MPQIMAFVFSVKSGLGIVTLASCSGVQSLTLASWLSFVVSAVEVVVVKLPVEEEGLTLL